MPERYVCGSYPGAAEWSLYSDEPAPELARRLCESAGCDSYSVDGTTYGADGTLIQPA